MSLSFPTSSLNLSASTVLKPTKGTLLQFNVTTAGAVGALHDCAATGDAAAGNKICTVPAVVGAYLCNFPFLTGLVYVPGASQVASIAYE